MADPIIVRNTRSFVPSTGLGLIYSLQYLRGVAALMVVWHHAREQLPNLKLYFPMEFAQSGVDLFFVISGFIMVVTTSGKQVRPGTFFLRRLIRVAPLYWLLTGLVVFLAYLSPSLFKNTNIEVFHVVQSLLFFPHSSPSHIGTFWPVLVPGWTLNFEMFFYALFATTLVFLEIYRVLVLAGMLLSLVGFGIIFGTFEIPFLSAYTNMVMLEFLIGAVLGHLWTCGRVIRSPWLAWCCLLCGAAMLLWRDAPYAPLSQIAGGALVVAGALFSGFRQWKCPPLLALGDASYSIYLTHIFTLGALRWIWVKFSEAEIDHGNGWLFMLSGLCSAACIGWVVYQAIEKPMTTVLNAWADSFRLRLSSGQIGEPSSVIPSRNSGPVGKSQ
jgi:exopolysaccharide production protein ExoZ